jgi:hypothetical protein
MRDDKSWTGRAAASAILCLVAFEMPAARAAEIII